MEKRLRATLRFQNGMELKGWSFGYDKPCDGEVVFSTAMVGYPEYQNIHSSIATGMLSRAWTNG